MKILLTGEPKSGKSTIISAFKDQYQGPQVGIVAHAVLDQEGIRQGFEAENSRGERKLFATRNITPSPMSIGKFHVDPKAIDDFFVPELEKGLGTDRPVVLLDEIGRMQSFSANFLSTVQKLFDSDVHLLGTIVYEDEPWSLPFKNHPEAAIISVTPENRDALPKLLVTMFSNKDLVDQLSEDQKKTFTTLLKEYAKDGKLMQMKKLLKNAVPYVTGGKVQKTSETEYAVNGNTRSHVVIYTDSNYACDCDLFNGRAEYSGAPGTCSHIQAVVLTKGV